MPEMLSSIGTFLSSTAGKGVLTAGTAGGGLLQNFMANRQAEKKQKFVQDLITNPAKFQQFVAGFSQPLSKGLTTDVARQADAYGAERGLGSSPAVMRSVDEQALAPFVQQQKDAAMQAALQSLGIYEQSPTAKPVDVSSIFKALQMAPGSTPNITAGMPLPPNAPLPLDILPQPTVGGDTGMGDLGF